jgi:hypothetical protein
MIYLSDLLPVQELRVGVQRLAADLLSRTYEPHRALSASRRGLEPEAIAEMIYLSDLLPVQELRLALLPEILARTDHDRHRRPQATRRLARPAPAVFDPERTLGVT